MYRKLTEKMYRKKRESKERLISVGLGLCVWQLNECSWFGSHTHTHIYICMNCEVIGEIILIILKSVSQSSCWAASSPSNEFICNLLFTFITYGTCLRSLPKTTTFLIIVSNHRFYYILLSDKRYYISHICVFGEYAFYMLLLPIFNEFI